MKYDGFSFKFKKDNPKLVPEGTSMLQLPFALSYSKITEWYNCPTKFYANYVTKEIKFQDTPQTLLGKEKHKALEIYGLTGEKSPCLEEQEYTLVTKIREAKDAIVLYEEQGIFGFTSIEFNEVAPLNKMWDKMPDGSPYFLLGVADLICVTGSAAVIVDHKSGKMKRAYEKPHETDKLRKNVEEGWFQLQLYAIQTFLRFPQVNKVKCILNYLKDNVQVNKVYTRQELAALQLTAKQTCQHILADYATFVEFKTKYLTVSAYKDLMVAHSEIYSRRSPLCDWCGYKSNCLAYQKRVSTSQRGFEASQPKTNISTSKEPLTLELL